MLSSFISIFKNLMIFSSYVENKSSFPKPLSKEKEAEYLIKHRAGDRAATEILIEHNLRLVAHIAKKYINYPDVDELISVGSIGLIKAINTFSPEKGTQLATYAAKCIENEILMVLRANKKLKNNVSLYDAVGTDREGNEITLADFVCEQSEGVILDVENRLMTEKIMQTIMEVLDEREYSIIKMRYGLGGTTALTQKEVAEKFGISRSYISRIEKKAIEKIRARLTRDEIF